METAAGNSRKQYHSAAVRKRARAKLSSWRSPVEILLAPCGTVAVNYRTRAIRGGIQGKLVKHCGEMWQSLEQAP